jgi:hypothetical protein
MYLKKVDLAAKKAYGWSPGTGGYDYVAAFLKLHVECPVCKEMGEFEVKPFHIDEEVRNLKANDQFVAVMEEFSCEKCGVSSRLPKGDGEKALAALTYKAVQDLKKNLPEPLRSLVA